MSSADDIKPDTIQKDYRDSLSAHLKMPGTPAITDEDIVVNCIEQRAAYFQGFIPIENLETLQVVKSAPLLFPESLPLFQDHWHPLHWPMRVASPRCSMRVS